MASGGSGDALGERERVVDARAERLIEADGAIEALAEGSADGVAGNEAEAL